METIFYVTNNNHKIAYWNEYRKDSNIGVILIHGLAEHKGRYKEFINSLLENSISVFALDLCGHGESSGTHGDIENFNQYLDDCISFIKYIKKKYPHLKLIIFGHSLGGLIATKCSIQNICVDGLILSSPLLIQPWMTKILFLIPVQLLGNIKIKKRFSESTEMLKYNRNDPLACQYLTLRLLKSVFIYGLFNIEKTLYNLSIPVLIMGGKFDNLLNSNKFKNVLNKINSNDKRLIIYENSRHRVVQNDDKEKAIKDILKWLNKYNT